MKKAPAVIFFDGHCGVCDAIVSWLLPYSERAEFRFSPLQGQTYAAVLARHPELAQFDSVVFVERLGQPDEMVTVRGTAALNILRRLPGAWMLPRIVGELTPGIIRNFLYDMFARYRTTFVKPKDSCRIPTPAERARFLD